MKKGIIIFLIMLPLGLCAQSSLIDKISDQLNQIKNYNGEVSFRVTQPMTDDEVIYTLKMKYLIAPSDSICGYYYLIDITSDSNPDINGDFNTYFSKCYINFSNQKWREYHWEENKDLFNKKTIGNKEYPGIQQSGLFVEELPIETERFLRTMRNNENFIITEYPDTIFDGKPVNALKIKEILKGETIRNIFIAFDTKTGLPIFRETENNPGNIGSQTVTTRYLSQQQNISGSQTDFSEEELLKDKSGIASLYRKNNFKAKSLVGKPTPIFSLPILKENSRFGTNDLDQKIVILAFLDTKSGFCGNAISTLNNLHEQYHSKGILFSALFKEKSTDAIDHFLLENPYSGVITYNSDKTNQDFGVTGYPTFFILSDGIVQEVYIGYSPEVERDITKKLEIDRTKR